MAEIIPLTPAGADSATEPFRGGACKLHPQTMCPAFGALRVLTRIEGAQPAMVTDTGCLYGLTFVTHFYAARKSIVAPALGTAELSSGKVQEAANAAIAEAASAANTTFIPVISLCVAETAGLAEELLPKEIDGKPVILVRVPAYAIHSHPEAKDVALAAVMRRFIDTSGDHEPGTLALIGEVFPADPLLIDGVVRRMGGRVVTTLPGRHVDEIRQAGRAAAVAALHPFYRETIGVLRERGVAVISGAPIGADGSAAWLRAIGAALELDEDVVERVAAEEEAAARGFLASKPLQGATILVSGYEGNEMLYARLLIEGGAHVPYVSTSIGPSALTAADEAWLKAHGTQAVIYRKTLEDDKAAMERWSFDLIIGTTTLAAYAKEKGIPAVYYTNILSVRPLFLAGGMIASLTFVRDLLNRKPIYDRMLAFFEGDDRREGHR
ncbi:MAG TPA: chlorophyllide a reductase subunit Y [Chloroflexus aurantiacus]|jgi:chlorophyllide a reductase subunit Y|uniref:Chlorophyllide reductase subunit Y n=1 Tax=Chloroflexus aurantiacus (strain ATCC 29366 / DSM 635 / J-10-fl) TaxID=324602 RepID=A9WCM1_CHLAA|nr:chlorophyllide a reductase subunit Y [Chloroflexus aurantiacus]ABY36983.1 chlorophyllide reductase subunit Y [Chloroflexus aurantiacus J-10-fl]RMG47725.1 MAG: chlorophyllide a reductase subunit Y [Chloroflexota bacterium]GIV95212.1 MAG: chlorophyllide reductase subunit Y [Chloroflexus sp.]HBW65862.1 chlorophyllide a reductase subunit Y [Chloroflexus aurantiacus]